MNKTDGIIWCSLMVFITFLTVAITFDVRSKNIFKTERFKICMLKVDKPLECRAAAE